MKVNMYEAKTRLSALVEAAINGEEVIISKSNQPMVRLVPYNYNQRILGGYNIDFKDDFGMADEEIQRMFEGEE